MSSQSLFSEEDSTFHENTNDSALNISESTNNETNHDTSDDDEIISQPKRNGARKVISSSENSSDEEVDPVEAQKTRRRTMNRIERAQAVQPNDESDISDEDEHSNDEDVDEDDEEESLLNATFSPTTRRSIAGYRKSMAAISESEGSEDLTEDEDDNEDEEKEKVVHKKSNTKSSKDGSSGTFDEEKYLYSPNTRKSIAGNFRATSSNLSDSSELLKTINYSDGVVQEKIDLTMDDSSSVRNSSTQLQESTPKIKPKTSDNVVDLTVLDDQSDNDDQSDEEQEPVAPHRPSYGLSNTKFEQSIKEKMSSTLSPSEMQDEDSSVIAIDDDSIETKPALPVKAKIQPTLPVIPKKGHSTKTVSRSFYEHEQRQLEDIEQQIKTLEALYQKSGAGLPDKGKGLLQRIETQRKKLTEQIQTISTLVVDEKISVKNSLRESSGVDVSKEQPVANFEDDSVEELKDNEQVGAVGIDWDAINKANAEMKPKHIGKQGLKTFEAQKASAENRLKEIHVNLQTQPTEDTLADTPDQLKIELMEHQKHALAWLKWRESKSPRGGILADDMGLGKTLSMIALILAKLDEEEEKVSDDDSDDEEVSGKWMNRGTHRYFPGGTLIVCPASVLGQWQSELTHRVRRGCLTFEQHHGPKREIKPKYLSRHDVVVTTYNIVSSEHKRDGPLFGIKWYRVILDEAHIIRTHTTEISKACAELRGKNRWALTGTPICNKKMDMFALLRFLRCTPFDELSVFKTWIDNRNSETRMHALMKTLMLRRTKAILQAKEQLKLPNKTIHVIDVVLSRPEMNVYQKVMIYSRYVFTEYLAQKGLHAAGAEKLNAIHAKVAARHGQTVGSAQILTLLLRLRQICCHPGLIHQMLDETDLSASAVEEGLKDFDLLSQMERLNIDHDNSGSDDIEELSAMVLNKANPVFNMNRPSSKLQAVLNHFKANVPDTDKVVIISQWFSMLELLKPMLDSERIDYCEINGQVQVKNRAEIIDTFNRAGGPQVMLLTLTAGGVGLNLCGANHLYLIDIHWNPQLENQAMDRVFRVGQKKDVNIYKFLCVETIEKKIEKIQADKLQLANSVLTGAKAIGSKLTMQDLRTLFDM